MKVSSTLPTVDSLGLMATFATTASRDACRSL
jgi:hypothetical protein